MPAPRHYPEVPAPNIEVPRGAGTELAAFVGSLQKAHRDWTQRLNAELRYIVDQLPPRQFFMGNEVVGGTIDGVNDTFVLAHAPDPAIGLQLFNRTVAGPLVLLVQNVDYRLGERTVYITDPAFIPLVDDELVAWYRYTE